MAIHFLHDVLAFSWEESGESAGVLKGGAELSSVIDMGIAFILCAAVVFYITRPRNTEKILKLWEKKWQGGNARPQSSSRRSKNTENAFQICGIIL